MPSHSEDATLVVPGDVRALMAERHHQLHHILRHRPLRLYWLRRAAAYFAL
jgi:hypothetical protein